MRRTISGFSSAMLLASGILLAASPTIAAQMRQNPSMGGNGNMNQTQPGMRPNNMPMNGSTTMQNNAQADFVATVRRNAKVETDLSKMALKNSSNDDVKKFASQVISENRRNETALTGATANANPSEMSFAAPVPSQTRDAEKQMKKLTGTQFDEMYLSQMDGYVKNDQKTISTAADLTGSPDMGSITMQLRNTADQRAKQIVQVAQSENFKVQ